jgi:hypothetical protein
MEASGLQTRMPGLRHHHASAVGKTSSIAATARCKQQQQQLVCNDHAMLLSWALSAMLQVWVKSPQMLTRDRLLGNYTVRPALDRLKRTMLGMGSVLAASFLLLAVVPSGQVRLVLAGWPAGCRDGRRMMLC